MLLRSHKPAGCKLTLDVSADRVPLDLDQSILLSLIANELLLNSLKHAFPGRGAGRIDTELRTTRDQVTLTVRDDGNGIVTPRAGINQRRGTGMDLVQAMSRQLGGEFAVNRLPAGGTSAIISFARCHASNQAFVCNSNKLPYAKKTYPDR